MTATNLQFLKNVNESNFWCYKTKSTKILEKIAKLDFETFVDRVKFTLYKSQI